MTHHYSITGFKHNKRNKIAKTLYLSTMLSSEQIQKVMDFCNYVYENIVDIDSFTDKPETWKNPTDVVVNLTLFDELRISKAITA